jgi:hypothetical protein
MVRGHVDLGRIVGFERLPQLPVDKPSPIFLEEG